MVNDGDSDGQHADGPLTWPHPLPERRLAPVPPEDRDPATEELLESLRIQPDQPVRNIFTTLAHHPRLLKRWSAMAGVLLFRGELPPRDRELLILRTAWNCRAHYEWGHHVDNVRRVGMSNAEIARIADGPDADGWPPADALLLRAADELHHEAQVSDATWAELAQRYGPAQLVELCMLVGQYHMVAFALNSLGVQLEADTGHGK
jgi:4-carboxymuconolactone decarboxylase